MLVRIIKVKIFYNWKTLESSTTARVSNTCPGWEWLWWEKSYVNRVSTHLCMYVRQNGSGEMVEIQGKNKIPTVIFHIIVWEFMRWKVFACKKVYLCMRYFFVFLQRNNSRYLKGSYTKYCKSFSLFSTVIYSKLSPKPLENSNGKASFRSLICNII